MSYSVYGFVYVHRNVDSSISFVVSLATSSTLAAFFGFLANGSGGTTGRSPFCGGIVSPSKS